MVFASGESPPSEWDSPARRFPPFPGGSPLQVNDIHLKGLPLSTANGIRFRGVPSSKRMVFSSRGFPLHSEWDSLQRIPLVNSEWDSIICVTPSTRLGFASRGSPSPKRMGFASRGSPSPKRLGFGDLFPSQTGFWQEGRFALPEELHCNPPHGVVVGIESLVPLWWSATT